MSAAFRTELDELIGDLAGMSRLASQIMITASAALLQADLALAELVLARGDEMDTLHHDVEQRCVRLFAPQDPDDVDSPTAAAALHAVADLQQMGNLAQHTARLAQLTQPDLTVSDDVRTVLAQMGLLASGLAQQAAAAIEQLDPLSGDRLARADGEVATLRGHLARIVFAENWPHGVGSAAHVALVGRYYESFADHAVAIARQVCDPGHGLIRRHEGTGTGVRRQTTHVGHLTHEVNGDPKSIPVTQGDRTPDKLTP